MTDIERTSEHDYVDLGTISAETKGPMGTQIEPGAIGRPVGLADGD